VKSAYELAMERLRKGQPDAPRLSDEQRKAIAEIDRRYRAKIAEREIMARDDLLKAGDAETAERIRQRLSDDVSRLRTECEAEKDRVRSQV